MENENRPSLQSIEAVLGYLGFDFVPIPRAKVIPPELVKRLQPIADDLALTMPETVSALVEIIGNCDRIERGVVMLRDEREAKVAKAKRGVRGDPN